MDCGPPDDGPPRGQIIKLTASMRKLVKRIVRGNVNGKAQFVSFDTKSCYNKSESLKKFNKMHSKCKFFRFILRKNLLSQ